MPNTWIERYEKKGALWLHDGNPQRPHALLTSGNHSDGYFNSKLVTEDRELLEAAAAALTETLLSDPEFDIGQVDRVVGPQTGATLLAQKIAEHISEKRRRSCLWASPAKVGEGSTKTMIFTDTCVVPGEHTLLVEDVLNTGGSVKLAARAVVDAGGTILSHVAVLVNRSESDVVDGRKVVSLIKRPMFIWTPEQCPLCAGGSCAIRPKGQESWRLLNV